MRSSKSKRQRNECLFSAFLTMRVSMISRKFRSEFTPKYLFSSVTESTMRHDKYSQETVRHTLQSTFSATTKERSSGSLPHQRDSSRESISAALVGKQARRRVDTSAQPHVIFAEVDTVRDATTETCTLVPAATESFGATLVFSPIANRTKTGQEVAAQLSTLVLTVAFSTERITLTTATPQITVPPVCERTEKRVTNARGQYSQQKTVQRSRKRETFSDTAPTILNVFRTLSLETMETPTLSLSPLTTSISPFYGNSATIASTITQMNTVIDAAPKYWFSRERLRKRARKLL